MSVVSLGRRIRVYRSVQLGGRQAGPRRDRAMTASYRTDTRSVQQSQAPFDRERPEKAGHRAPWHHLHHRCVGCGTQGRPGRSDSRFVLHERSEDRRRGTRRIGAAAAFEWPAVRSVLREAVPDEVRAGSAGAPARMPGASRPAVCGCRCTSRSAQSGAGGTPIGKIGGRRARREARATLKPDPIVNQTNDPIVPNVCSVCQFVGQAESGPRHRSDAARDALRSRRPA